MADNPESSPINAAADTLTTGKLFVLLLLVTILGAIGALFMVLFFFLEDLFVALFWQGINLDSLVPVFDPRILVICATGGLIVGLIRWYFKGDIAIMAEDLIEFNKEGRFSAKKGVELFFRGLVSLVAGAPLGPEAPLTVSTGAAGTVIAEKARLVRPMVTLSALSTISGFFGAFLSSPFAGALIFIETTLEKGGMTWKVVLPSIVAATGGVAVYFLISGTFLSAIFTLPPYPGFQDIDLLYAILLGLIGAACGIFFIILYKAMRSVFEPLEGRPVILGLAGGIGLGVVGMVLPLILFMGTDQLQFLVDNYLEVGILLLLSLILVKILLITFLYSTGFAGGYIFPSFFIGGTAGILVYHIFPFIPLAVCVVCGIAGVSVTLLRSPIALALIIGLIFQVELVPAVAIALVTGFLASYRFSLPYTRRGENEETGSPEGSIS
jgi:chloride channel protein, CIC family